MRARSSSVHTAGWFCVPRARLTAAPGGTLARGFFERLSDCSSRSSEFGLGIASSCACPKSKKRGFGSWAENCAREVQIAYKMLSFFIKMIHGGRMLKRDGNPSCLCFCALSINPRRGHGAPAAVASWVNGGSMPDFQKSAMINEAELSTNRCRGCSDAPPARLVITAFAQMARCSCGKKRAVCACWYAVCLSSRTRRCTIESKFKCPKGYQV
jgi:hypothetical protein